MSEHQSSLKGAGRKQVDDFAEALEHPLVDEVLPVGASHDQQLDGRIAAMGEPLLPVVLSAQ
jgi:hypothetical protein